MSKISFTHIWDDVRKRLSAEKNVRAMNRLADALEKKTSERTTTNRRTASLERPGATDLPPGEQLLAEYGAFRAAGKTNTQAHAELYRKYKDVSPDTIRRKLNRAKEKVLGSGGD